MKEYYDSCCSFNKENSFLDIMIVLAKSCSRKIRFLSEEYEYVVQEEGQFQCHRQKAREKEKRREGTAWFRENRKYYLLLQVEGEESTTWKISRVAHNLFLS